MYFHIFVKFIYGSIRTIKFDYVIAWKHRFLRTKILLKVDISFERYYFIKIMKNRLLDIVVMLAEKARDSANFWDEKQRYKEELMRAGYSPEDIERGFVWFSERFKQTRSLPMRLLSSYERSHLTSDGCGQLLKLRNLGLLTDEHLEMIIARAIILEEGPIDAEDIRSFATAILFDMKGASEFPIYLDSTVGDKPN